MFSGVLVYEPQTTKSTQAGIPVDSVTLGNCVHDGQKKNERKKTVIMANSSLNGTPTSSNDGVPFGK